MNENKTNAPIKLPVEMRFDPTDGYAAVRIYDADGDLFLNIHNSERWRNEKEMAVPKAVANQIVAALNEADALRDEGKTVLITQDRDNLVRLAMLIEQKVGRSRSFDLFTNEELWKSVFESAEELLKLPDLVTERLRAEVEKQRDAIDILGRAVRSANACLSAGCPKEAIEEATLILTGAETYYDSPELVAYSPIKPKDAETSGEGIVNG